MVKIVVSSTVHHCKGGNGLKKRLKINVWPQTLKARLFTSFMIFIVLPFFLIQMYYYQQIGEIMSSEINALSKQQLQYMKNALEQLTLDMSRSVFKLERDDATAGLSDTTPFVSESAITSRLQLAQASFFPYTEFIELWLVDAEENLYGLDGLQTKEEYERFYHQSLLASFEKTGEVYKWRTDDRYLELQSVIPPSDSQPFTYVSIQLDMQAWLQYVSKDMLFQQSYFILDQEGTPLYQSDSRSRVTLNAIEDMVGSKDSFSVIDNEMLVNGQFSPNLGLYLVSQFAMDTFFGNLQQMRMEMFVSMFILAIVFISITFLISSKITHPLQQLRRKMSLAVEQRFRTKLSLQPYRGELLDLAVTFNQMMSDMGQLIQKLKIEERQKEVVKFQMLLAQMNPHFLLNTLNALKWNAMEHGDQKTADICTALGKLLETSLNVDLELIHLRHELELIQVYVDIQSFRFDVQFQVIYEMDDQLSYVLVPKLSLQPLVENSIEHGFTRNMNEAKIVVRIYRDQQYLVMEVEDNGRGLQESKRKRVKKRKGIGLLNVKERLQLLYKQDYSFELKSLPNGTLVRMRIPLLISEPYKGAGDHHVDDSHR